MPEQRKWPWPMWVLALDIVGTLFLVAGLLGHFMVDELPGGEQLGPLAIPLIILGVVMMIPLVVFSIRSARSPK